MPLALSRGDRRLLIAGGTIFVLLIGLGSLLAPTKGADHPTTYSAASGGAKALYLLLHESGYDVARWEQPVYELPAGTRTTLILADPLEYPNDAERSALWKFVNSGGHVLVTGDLGAYFLSATVQRDPVEGLLWKPVKAVGPSAITRAAPVITLAPLNSWSTSAFGIPLYGDQDDQHVVMVPIGAGRAIWAGTATPLTNAGIREPGNLEFVLACLGRPGERRVLFDEYIHGHRRTLAGSIWRSPTKWILVQGLVLALVLVATYARRSGPILLPATESRLSPLEFVRTLGSLYARAGAASVAVEMASQRFRSDLSRRLGLSPLASIDDLERALAGRSATGSATLISTLRQCEEARETHRLHPKSALRLVKELGRAKRELNLDIRASRASETRERSGARGAPRVSV
jgi:hypothetical protein